MTSPTLHVLVPGSLDQRTGGYLYDRRMVEGLRRLGWRVDVHNLAGSFPDGDETADAALNAGLAQISHGARVLIDGLAMGGLPGPIQAHGDRLQIISLVHHPLADETGLSPEDQIRFRESERAALAPCTGVIVTSAYTARRLEAYGVETARVRAVAPGTEPARPAQGPGPDRPPSLLCVATVTPRKGHRDLIAALALLRHLDWTCVCAGSLDRDPSYADSVQRLVAEEGLSDRIVFVGEHESDALDGMYQRSSLFVLASYYEGYGMALTEALARGLPIVSTTGGAIPYTVPAESGILVPPGDVRALADALETLLASERLGEDGRPRGALLREALSAAARRHAMELPDWEESVDRFARAVLDLAPDAHE